MELSKEIEKNYLCNPSTTWKMMRYADWRLAKLRERVRQAEAQVELVRRYEYVRQRIQEGTW